MKLTKPITTDKAERDDLMGAWDRYLNRKYKGKPTKPHLMGSEITGRKAAEFLNLPTIHTIEDWGSGHGGFRKYTAPHQTCVNVDGSESPHTDKVVDLRTYKTQVEAIHLRHVLEHNHHWFEILDNLIASFEQRAVVTLFVPLGDETKVIKEFRRYAGRDVIPVDIQFALSDLEPYLNQVQWTMEEVKTPKSDYGIDTMFYLEKSS